MSPALAGLAQNAAQKICAARDFVRESKVDIAAVRVWDRTRHYHAWSKRDDSTSWNLIGVSEILDEPEFSFEQTTWSSGFRWGDRSWIFTLTKIGLSYLRDHDVGKFSVNADDELVMELEVVGVYNECAR